MDLSKKIKITLFLLLLFINFNTIFSAVTNCNPISSSNSLIELSGDIYCGSGYDFSNFHNVTLNCKGYQIQAGGSHKINLSNSDISFIYCDFNYHTTTFVDTLSTNISIIQQAGGTNYGDNGTYNYISRIWFNITNNYGEPIDDIRINMSSNILNTINLTNINDTNKYYYLKFGSRNSTNLTFYNNFTVTASSNFFNSNKSIQVNLTPTSVNYEKIISIILNDNATPILLNLTDLKITNQSLKLNFTFDELVNGTFNIYNSSNNLIENKLVSTLNKEHIITFNNLNSKSLYKVNFDGFDRNNNRLVSNLKSYWTYITLNYTLNSGDYITYTKDPENTSSFSFLSSNYNIGVNFTESVNLSNNLNFSDEIQTDINYLFINSSKSTRFNKSADISFFNLPYQTTPVVLRNSLICNPSICSNINYSVNDLSFHVTGFSNYSTISNSYLFVNTTIPYVGKNITIYANYSKYNDSNPITLNSYCNLTIDSNTYQMIFNSSSNLFKYTLNKYNTKANHNYFISCNATNYDYKALNKVLNLTYQNLDNFTAYVDFIHKNNDSSSHLTINKYLNISIISFGSNNTNSSNDAKYSFLISKKNYNPITGWNSTYALTNWVDIGKNEYLTIENFGSNFTNVTLSNSTRFLIPYFIFQDIRDQYGAGSSLYVNLRVCVPGNNCKYFTNSSNYLIFEDTTPPVYLNISIKKFFNSKTNLNFSYFVRDLESKVKNSYFNVILNSSSTINPNISIGFNETNSFNYYSSGYNFLEGNYYKLLFRSENNINLLSNINQSTPFLIDTLAPINSSINISVLNENNYTSLNIFNVSLNPGFDYNINYTNLNLSSSGLNYMNLYIANASLSNNICNIFSNYNKINKTFYSNNTSYKLNLSSNYCYKIKYNVYDNAMNLNSVLFNKILKIDSTKPIVNTLNTGVTIMDYLDDNTINVDSLYFDIYNLDINSTIFNVRYDISDSNSLINYYNISLIDSTLNKIVLNTSTINSNYSIKYNSSYIIDGHNYRVSVYGVNNAGLKSSTITSNGVTIYLSALPHLRLDSNNLFAENQIIDYSNDGSTILNFYELKNITSTCRYYYSDVGYDENSGTLCSIINGNIQCNFNTVLGINNFSVSCIENQSVQGVHKSNNNTNNLDIKINVTKNKKPYINIIRLSPVPSFSQSNIFNIFENDTFIIQLYFMDNNSINNNYFNASYKKIINNNLNVSTTGFNLDVNNIILNFIKSSTINESKLIYSELGNYWNKTYNYTFYFNNSINYSKIIQLNNNININSKLSFSTSNLSQNISNSIYNIKFNNSNIISINSGISNLIKLNNLSQNNTNYHINSLFNLNNNNNNYISWNLSDFTNRRKVVILNLSYSDYLLSNSNLFYINISPIFYPVKINTTYYNLNNNFTLLEQESKIFNLSKYFYEENNIMGIENNLTYSYNNNDTNNFNILSFNSTTGILNISNLHPNSNPQILFKVKDSKNNTQSVPINFTINKNLIPPVLTLHNPINGQVLKLPNKEIFFNLSLDLNSTIYFINNNHTYGLCNNCNNFSSNITMNYLNKGDNNITFYYYDNKFHNLNSTKISINFNLDSDQDGIINDLDSDLDGDGINNINDSVNGLISNIITNINNLNLTVNQSSNLSKKYNQTLNTTLKTNNITLVSFLYNFSNSSLNLSDFNIKYNNSNDIKYMLIAGLNNIKNKSIFIEKSTNSSLNAFCIKDQEVYDISQISTFCNQTNEYYISCPSNTNNLNNNYSCYNITQNNTEYWKISGLKHSGVKTMCSENWVFNNTYETCSNNQKLKIFEDNNSCNTNFLKPIEYETCGGSSGSGTSSGSGSGGGSSSTSSGGGSGFKGLIINNTNQEPAHGVKINHIVHTIKLGTTNNNLDNINILIDNNKLSNNNSYNTIKKIQINSKSNNKLIEFDFDFSKYDLDVSKINIKQNKTWDNLNYILINNLNLHSMTKTIYLDKKSNSNKVCIKDSDIDYIALMTPDCSGYMEKILTCDGINSNGYSCIISNNKYIISGLSHSAVREVQPLKKTETQKGSSNNITTNKLVDFPNINNSKMPVKDKNNYNIFIIIFIIVIVVIILFFIIYNYKNNNKNNNITIKNKPNSISIKNNNNNDNNKKEETNNYNFKYTKIISVFNCYNKENIKYVNFEFCFNNYNNIFNDINSKEKKMLNTIQTKFHNKIYSNQVTWIEAYFYFKNNNIKNYFLQKLFKFDLLLNYSKNFYEKYKNLSLTDEELNEHLKEDKVFNYLNLYPKNQDFINEYLFLITGSRIYNFKKEKYLDLFNSEFEKAIKKFRFKYSQDYVFKKSIIDLKLINYYQNDLKELLNLFVKLKGELNKTQITQIDKKDNLIKKIDKKIENINIKLK